MKTDAQRSTITVVADDITGAAEIAGIGWRFGLRVNLIMYSGEENNFPPPESDLVVYATDTRSMSADEAIAQTFRLGKAIHIDKQNQLFKKTDSVLRGHIVAELKALMRCSGKKRALLLPQNPSKQRIIRQGVYYIQNTPLHETAFAYDPEFPAKTSHVTTYLGEGTALLPSGASTVEEGIWTANASTEKEISFYASMINQDVIAAGSADFFTAYLQSKGYNLNERPPFSGLGSHALIICGSTAKHNISAFPYIRRNHIPECNIPEDVFRGGNPEEWISLLKKTYQLKGALIISINHPPQEGKVFAVQLRKTISYVTRSLLSAYQPQELIIEGGATAYTILHTLRWNTFHIECEISPGVIRITSTSPPYIYITLKPGSYPWGILFD